MMDEHCREFQTRIGKDPIENHEFPILERAPVRNENANPQRLGHIHNCVSLRGLARCRPNY
jgi:hypothetical protein